MTPRPYILDSNVISDVLRKRSSVLEWLQIRSLQDNPLCLCQPVYYEVQRGLLQIGASRQIQIFQDEIRPLLTWIELTD